MVELQEFLENTPRNNAIVQRALREIDTEVLATALVGLTEEIQRVFLRNMSKRACALIVQDIEEKEGADPTRIQQARELLAQLLGKSARSLLRPRPRPDDEPIPTVRLDSPESVIATFTAFAAYVRKHGLLSLERVEGAIPHPLMRKGIEFLVDGLDSLMVRSMLEKYKNTYLRGIEATLDMILDGIDCLQSAEHPHVVEQKLRAYVVQP